MARRTKTNIFSRATPAPLPKPRPADFGIDSAELADRKRWADSIPPPDLSASDVEELRASDSLRELERIRRRRGSVPPAVIRALEGIDPNGSYRASFIVDDYVSDEEFDDNAPPDYGQGARRRIVFIGLGHRIIDQAVNLADRAQIVSLRLQRLARPMDKREIYPLYDDDMMRVESGRRLKGSGQRPPRKGKTGPRPYHGRRTKAADKLLKDAERQAKARGKRLGAKIKKLRAQGKHAEADKLEARSARARKSSERAQSFHKVGIRGTPFVRMKPPTKPKRRK